MWVNLHSRNVTDDGCTRSIHILMTFAGNITRNSNLNTDQLLPMYNTDLTYGTAGKRRHGQPRWQAEVSIYLTISMWFTHQLEQRSHSVKTAFFWYVTPRTGTYHSSLPSQKAAVCGHCGDNLNPNIRWRTFPSPARRWRHTTTSIKTFGNARCQRTRAPQYYLI